MNSFFSEIARTVVRESARGASPALMTGRVARLEADGTCHLRIFGINGQDEDAETLPARIMMPTAGRGSGIHFLPEPGDEVVCAFLGGEAQDLIVLGALWNGTSTVPSQARQSEDNHVRTIVSRSGHELTFDDTPDAEKVTLRSKGGHTVVLDDAPGGPKVTVSSHGGRTITLDDTPPGRASIRTSGCQITMSDATGSIAIESTASISINAPAVSIQGVPFRTHVHVLGTATTGPVAV